MSVSVQILTAQRNNSRMAVDRCRATTKALPLPARGQSLWDQFCEGLGRVRDGVVVATLPVAKVATPTSVKRREDLAPGLGVRANCSEKNTPELYGRLVKICRLELGRMPLPGEMMGWQKQVLREGLTVGAVRMKMARQPEALWNQHYLQRTGHDLPPDLRATCLEQLKKSKSPYDVALQLDEEIDRRFPELLAGHHDASDPQ